jgi:DNA helicase-2/ATP-dependent DNA helicase PcrA
MSDLLFETAPLPEAGGELRPNGAQRRAIEHGEGPLLVIAGAGTGKTRVITERIRYLLETDPAAGGEGILALTFTRKAAGEMKSRVVRDCGERGKDVTLATFHSFCETLLQENEPGRRALEKIDHWILLRRNMKRLQLEKFRRLAEPGQFLSNFIEFFSRCQDELVSAEGYSNYANGLAATLAAEKASLDGDTYRERAQHVALQQEIARAYRASEELLREKNAVSLNGLVNDAVRLLQGDAALRERLRERYRHILVDEFQDTNIAQLELLALLGARSHSIVAVGDNDQAIYRFRGASFASFKLFLERFVGWKEGEDSSAFRVALTQNYRSTPNVLRVATQVIAQNTTTADFPKKALHATKPEGQRVRIAELSAPEEESVWIARELERLHGDGRRWSDMAVLYRKHMHRNELVAELVRRKIPFAITKLSILEHPLVRDVIAYLRLIAKPYDDVACARVLSAPAWRQSPESLVRLLERAGKRPRKALYDTLQEPQPSLPFESAPVPVPAALLEFVSAARKSMRKRAALEIFTELLEWLAVAQRARPRDRQFVKRLGEFIKEWEPKSESRGLPEFLEYLDYFQQAGGTIDLEEDAPGEAVRLMTVHAAKGLEFPCVFVLRVNNRAFPAGARKPLFEFPAALMKEELPEGDFHIQEERRLFYVALTRAEDRLTLSTVTEKKGKVPLFVEDILMDANVKKQDVLQIAPKPAADASVAEAACAKASVQGELLAAGEEPARIGARIAQWSDEYSPPLPEPLHLSVSAVQNYRKCPRQFLFGRCWGLTEGPKAALTFGNVMHNTIRRAVEQLKKGGRLPFEDVAAIYQAEWRSAGFEDEYQEGEYKKDGVEQLKTFHAALLAAPPKVHGQELAFELPAENGIVVMGRMDQVNALGKNTVEIVDYKTGAPRPERDVKKDLQLSIYALAARESFGWDSARLVLHFLQTGEVVATTREPRELDDAMKIVQETAANIRAGHFPATPGFACRSCAYKPICPAHELAPEPR